MTTARRSLFARVSTLAAAVAAVACGASSNDEGTSEAAQTAAVNAIASDYDCAWYQKENGFDDAVKTLASRGLKPGQGITIGLIDTGYLPNPEFMTPAVPGVGVILPEADRLTIGLPTNFVENDHAYDALDRISPSHSVVDTWGHGTSNLSLLLGVGLRLPGEVGQVRGVVPYARVLPIRVSTGVVLLTPEEVSAAANGVRSALGSGAKVISMSMGAGFDTAPPAPPPPSTSFDDSRQTSPFWTSDPPLQHAADLAEAAGAIFVAAAGQGQQLRLARPASFANVIGVGGAARGQKAWDSTRGAAVVISAPAEGICVSEVAGPPDARGAYTFRHRKYDGTSYSTVFVSAVAAMWLEYHGYDNLVKRYGKKNLGRVFRYVLVTGGHTTPRGWDAEGHGVGIVNADMTLKAPLPDCSAVADECAASLKQNLATLGH